MSRRMGQDKALMPFLGQPLIERVVKRLAVLDAELLITTNHPDAYAFLGLPMVQDMLPGRGALGGLLTALTAAAHPGVAVVACDMPFILPDLLQAQYRLLEEENVDVVIPRSKNGLEPFHAVYRRNTCLPAVRGALEAGEQRIISWFPQVRVREMTLEEIKLYDPHLYSLINVNRLEEFQEVEALARRLEDRPEA